jgi:hypothetical protein
MRRHQVEQMIPVLAASRPHRISPVISPHTSRSLCQCRKFCPLHITTARCQLKSVATLKFCQHSNVAAFSFKLSNYCIPVPLRQKL